jgi:hypothetical protein
MLNEKFGFIGESHPAFPMQTRDGHETFNTPLWGLTKREYFASRALQGMLAGVDWASPKNVEAMVTDALKLADNLILQLANKA